MTAAIHSIDLHRSPNLRPLEIRRDLRAVADLVELCFAETLDADGRRYIHQIRAAAENPRTLGLVSRVSSSLSGYVWEENGRIVGNLSLLPVVAMKRQSYLIANVVVHPDYRRRGIARSQNWPPTSKTGDCRPVLRFFRPSLLPCFLGLA